MWCCQRGDVFLWESCEVFRTGVVPSWEFKWGPRMKMPVNLLTVLTLRAPLINGFYQGKSLFSSRWWWCVLGFVGIFLFLLVPPRFGSWIGLMGVYSVGDFLFVCLEFWDFSPRLCSYNTQATSVLNQGSSARLCWSFGIGSCVLEVIKPLIWVKGGSEHFLRLMLVSHLVCGRGQ